jgi:uncharacterized C2H2 Zn-finger protein
MTEFTCEHCDKTFGRKDNLKAHINTVHLKKRNFKCEHCESAFGRKGDLQTHINQIHLKQKDFKCDQCDYICGQKGNLQRHINLVHLKQKNFKCDLCDESFGRKGNLDRHVNAIHANPKPKNMSRGEQSVYDILEEIGLEHGTDFKTEYKFKTLLGIGNRQLRYDFVVFDKEDLLLIEFDGRQHYKPVKWQNNESDEKIQQRYQMTRCHDKRKNKYAKKHEYPLLRIKYSDVNKSKELIEEFFKDYSTILDL